MKAVDKLSVYQELCLTYEKYIFILNQEITDLALMAAVHGWKSHRVEVGQAFRDRIAALKKEANFDTSFLYEAKSPE